jgi:hypothetical protein
MKTKHTLLTLSLLSLLNVAVLAQEGGPRGPGGPGRPPGNPLFGQLDANHDQVIDAAELGAAPGILKGLDKDGDGLVSLAELRPQGRGPGRGPGRGRGEEGAGEHPAPPTPPSPPADGERGERGGPRGKPPFIKVLDANGDGSLDATEIANATKALLTLDKNGDGQLSEDEIRPAGGERRGPGGPGGPGGRRKGPAAE